MVESNNFNLLELELGYFEGENSILGGSIMGNLMPLLRYHKGFSEGRTSEIWEGAKEQHSTWREQHL